jgi:hypothetical protein
MTLLLVKNVKLTPVYVGIGIDYHGVSVTKIPHKRGFDSLRLHKNDA